MDETIAQLIARFNPRSRVGSDPSTPEVKADVRRFNPRSRVGSDGVNVPSDQVGRWFQSTLPRGERLFVRRAAGCVYCFNPRSRVGSDIHVGAWLVFARLFQSTLPRGERPVFHGGVLYHAVVSIHAPAWGATLSSKPTCMAATCFNPRSRVGSDRIIVHRLIICF